MHLTHGLLKETITALMMLYKNSKAMVCLLDGDTDFFYIINIVLLRNTLAHFITFTDPSARAGYDTWSIFKQNLTGLNSEYSFS